MGINSVGEQATTPVYGEKKESALLARREEST